MEAARGVNAERGVVMEGCGDGEGCGGGEGSLAVWTDAVESATSEATSSSTRGSGGAPCGPALPSPWECRAAQSPTGPVPRGGAAAELGPCRGVHSDRAGALARGAIAACGGLSCGGMCGGYSLTML